jgi:hypothetical protein
MAKEHSSKPKCDAEAQAPVTSRQSQADRLPFFLRAWWLRDFELDEELVWPESSHVTGAVWSTQSDPLSDVAGIDYPDVV